MSILHQSFVILVLLYIVPQQKPDPSIDVSLGNEDRDPIRLAPRSHIGLLAARIKLRSTILDRADIGVDYDDKAQVSLVRPSSQFGEFIGIVLSHELLGRAMR